MQGHSRKGGFDTLRLFAALLVFHSHSFALAGLPEPTAPGWTWGGVAVTIFFTMSGYWVTRSALERSLSGYATARALRIVPGLFVCCVVTIGLCALATSENVNDYFRDRETWRWLQNALPFFRPQLLTLPGVFEDGAFHVANGSLWTLPYEVFCYVLAAMAATFGPKGMRFAMAAAAVYAAVVLFGAATPAPLLLTSALDARWVALYAGAFFYGAALNEATDAGLAKLVVVSALALLLTMSDPQFATPIAALLFGGAAIWVGRKLDRDRRITRGWDISYGVYIYAFPCEQLAVRALPPHDRAGFALYYATALGATLLLALASWVLVERPALGAKRRIAGLIERSVGRLPLSRAQVLREPQT